MCSIPPAGRSLCPEKADIRAEKEAVVLIQNLLLSAAEMPPNVSQRLRPAGGIEHTGL